MPRRSEVWVSYQVNALVTKRRDGRVLMVMVQRGPEAPESWLVVALESRAADSTASAVDAVLEDHAHENVGTFPDEDEARGAASRYAARWRRRRAPRRCGCGEVAG
jgi:hypothetical protein